MSAQLVTRKGQHLTCKHRRFEQLDELVDLNEHVDRHFKIGATMISLPQSYCTPCWDRLQDLKKMICLFIGLGQET